MIIKDMLLAFFFGGFLCVICQIIIDKTSLAPARILVIFVMLGIFLGAIGVYEPLIEIFGCGATLPLSGYGANIAKGVKNAILEEGPIGIITGSFTAASAGCTAALLSGFLASLISHGKRRSF